MDFRSRCLRSRGGEYTYIYIYMYIHALEVQVGCRGQGSMPRIVGVGGALEHLHDGRAQYREPGNADPLVHLHARQSRYLLIAIIDLITSVSITILFENSGLRAQQPTYRRLGTQFRQK